MISPSDMVLFAAVVRTGSFTRAASELGVTKQTASERISKLEGQLGVRLLERTTRKLRFTPAGATYFDRCSAIAALIEEANREAQQQEPEPVGLLRVSSPSLFGRRYLTPIVAGFLGKHPRASVELVLTDRRVNLIEEGLDLAIHIGPMEDSSLVAKKLGAAPMHYVASASFLKKHGSPKPRDVRSARCIGLHPIEFWDVGGVKSRVEPVLTVNDLEVACDAAIAGVGIARVPSILSGEAVRKGRLKILFSQKPAMLREIHAVYPSRVKLPARVRFFVDALAAQVEPMLR